MVYVYEYVAVGIIIYKTTVKILFQFINIYNNNITFLSHAQLASLKNYIIRFLTLVTLSYILYTHIANTNDVQIISLLIVVTML